MAQKESQHKEQIDDLSSQLLRVTRQLDDLTVLSRDQVNTFILKHRSY
jgi:kinesin family protein 4/21/27